MNKIKNNLGKVIELLSKIDEKDFTVKNAKLATWDYATEAGRGIVLWAFRYALSGKEKSPDPFILLSVFGKISSIDRIKNTIKILG